MVPDPNPFENYKPGLSNGNFGSCSFFSHAFQIFWLPVVGLGSLPHHLSSILSESAVLVFLY